jgi:hypothetical protein
MADAGTDEAASGELVAADARVIEPAKPAGQVAATTVGAGAGRAAIVRGRRGRRGRRAARRFRRGRRDLNVVATRSFLVDVHVLDPRP